MEINVTKRSGYKERFSTEKIKEVISWACSGLDVNSLELESKIDSLSVEGITTQEIHDNVIHHAQALARADTPDWVYVAGRLNTMKRWKDTRAYEMEFKVYFNDMVKSGRYSHPALDSYSEQDLDYLERFIIQERDLQHSYGSTLTANKKYLLDGECIQHAFMVNAMIIFEHKTLRDVVGLYNALSLRKISLATPWLSNLRSGGNISSCFIISIDDNSDSIASAIKQAINISRNGGGLGIYLGNLRAGGSDIAGREGAAKSVNLAAKVFNDIALWFDQGGKRAGAFTLALPVWHNDIEDFLHIQSEVGDLRNKAYDIFPQICIPDIFMQTDLSEDRTWYTFCPHELKDKYNLDLNTYGDEFTSNYLKAKSLALQGKLKVFSKLDTRKILKDIMRTQFETGLPYLSFTDTMNKVNPNNHIGDIPCTNLCVESYSTVIPDLMAHTCNLASVVAGRMESYEDFIKYSELLVEVLDSGIGLTNPPSPESDTHNNSLRTIGVGIQGLADWLALNNTNYHNKLEIRKVAEYIEFGAIKASVRLAKEVGQPYPMFKGSKWDTGELMSNFKRDSVTDLDWDALSKELSQYGIRNSQLTSPAPNTSTSVFMDASAGVLPIYSAFFREDNDNGKYPVSCMHLKTNPLGYSKTFRHYDQTDVVEAIGELQKFTDTGISAEYLFDHNKENFNAKDLYDLIHKAWQVKTKAVYYIRNIKKGETVDDLLGIKDEGCVGCAG